MIALAFAGFGAVAANAQSTIETPALDKYSVATNSFWSNWFIQVGVDMSVQNPYGSNFFSNDWHDGRTYGVDLAVGKWFTPGLGLRTKLNWENGILERKHAWGAPAYDEGGYGALYGDVLFNLSNLFCGYKESRVWNLSLYPRAGVVRNFSANTYASVIGFGMQNTWRMGKKVSLYIDLAYNMTSTDFTGVNASQKFNANGYVDMNIGLQFNLGKGTFDKAISIEDYNALAARSEEALARLRADLDRERELNADLRAQLAKAANRPSTASVSAQSVVASAPASVFFDINSSKLNSKKDLINLESIAASAKASGAHVQVTGAADSKTGSAAYNQKLSEARAQAVADELVKLGVNRDNIETRGVGGVNEVAPFNLNRRAIIVLK